MPYDSASSLRLVGVVFEPALVRERRGDVFARDRRRPRVAVLVDAADHERPVVQTKLVGEVVEVGVARKLVSVVRFAHALDDRTSGPRTSRCQPDYTADRGGSP